MIALAPAELAGLTFAGSLLIALAVPFVIIYVTQRQAHADKEEEWKRQDLVAQRLAAANRRQAAANQKAAADNAQAVTEVAEKVDVVHGIVNSEKTAGMERELVLLRSNHAGLIEIADIKSKQGHKPTATTTAAIVSIATKIEELETELGAREHQQTEADALKTGKPKPISRKRRTGAEK